MMIKKDPEATMILFFIWEGNALVWVAWKKKFKLKTNKRILSTHFSHQWKKKNYPRMFFYIFLKVALSWFFLFEKGRPRGEDIMWPFVVVSLYKTLIVWIIVLHSSYYWQKEQTWWFCDGTSASCWPHEVIINTEWKRESERHRYKRLNTCCGGVRAAHIRQKCLFVCWHTINKWPKTQVVIKSSTLLAGFFKCKKNM